MKIVLVNPPSPPEYRVSRGLMGGFGMIVGEGLCYPPLDLLYVAAVLERAGHRVRVVDAEALGLQPDEVRFHGGDRGRHGRGGWVTGSGWKQRKRRSHKGLRLES